MCCSEVIDGRRLIRLCKVSAGAVCYIFSCIDILALIASVAVIQTHPHELCSSQLGFIALWLITDNILNFAGKVSLLTGLFYGKSIDKQIAKLTVHTAYERAKKEFAVIL